MPPRAPRQAGDLPKLAALELREVPLPLELRFALERIAGQILECRGQGVSAETLAAAYLLETAIRFELPAADRRMVERRLCRALMAGIADIDEPSLYLKRRAS